MNFNELTPEEKRRLIEEYPYPSRMNYDPSGITNVRPVVSKSDTMSYIDTGKAFKGQSGVPVFSLTDMRRNPERYYNLRRRGNVHSYMVDATDVGYPDTRIYNEFGKETRLTTRTIPPIIKEEEEENPNTLRKMSAKAKGR